MTTITLPPLPRPSLPLGYSCYPCAFCQAAVLVPEDAPEAPACRQCQRAHAEAAAHQALSDVRDLVLGTGMFAILDSDARREQLAGYGLRIEPARNDADAPDAATRDELESRIEADAIEQLEGERWDGLS